MRDYEYLFATTLHEKIKKEVVGKVFVKVTTEDKLYVNIKTFGDIEYVLTVDNFSQRIMNGWSTDYAAYEVLNRYRTFIMKRYFQTKKEF